MIIQLTGLSGAGKSTLAIQIKEALKKKHYKVEILDGDEVRNTISRDLGFSKEDRIAHLRRMGFIAQLLAKNEIIVLIAAISPYEAIRMEIKNLHQQSSIAWVNCSLDILIERDTKGLYKKAFLAENDPNKIRNLTGIGDTYEQPIEYDVKVDTDEKSISQCSEKIVQMIMSKCG